MGSKPILEDKDYTHLCHMMEDVVQLTLNEDQQELRIWLWQTRLYTTEHC